jgi:predicted AlkP superfamily phosphohydrolase/phosphomutase
MPAVYTFENDTGPDDANHDRYGIFVLDLPGARGAGECGGLQLMDVAPTALRLMGLPVPRELEGTALEI